MFPRCILIVLVPYLLFTVIDSWVMPTVYDTNSSRISSASTRTYTPQTSAVPELKTRATSFLCDGLSAFTSEVTRQRDRGISQATVMAAKDSATREIIGFNSPGASAMTYEIILLVYSHPTWSAAQAQARIEPLCLQAASETPFVP
jgi:hypothetical protein